MFSGVSAMVLLLAGTLLMGFMDLSKTVSSALMIRALKLFILAPGILGLLLMAGVDGKTASVTANLAYLGFALWLIREAVILKQPKRINWAIMLIGLLVFTRFIDYFGTMLQSGVAFIVAGLFFVGSAWLLNQGRKKLLAAAGRGKP